MAGSRVYAGGKFSHNSGILYKEETLSANAFRHLGHYLLYYGAMQKTLAQIQDFVEELTSQEMGAYIRQIST